MSTPEAETRAAVEGAISEALRSGGDMLTRWVLLAEVIDGDTGERGVWCLTAEDMKAWDALGLLVYAQQLEQAGVVADHLDGNE